MHIAKLNDYNFAAFVFFLFSKTRMTFFFFNSVRFNCLYYKKNKRKRRQNQMSNLKFIKYMDILKYKLHIAPFYLYKKIFFPLNLNQKWDYSNF